MNKPLTINNIPFTGRVEIRNLIIELGRSRMLWLMNSFKGTEYSSLGYESILARYGQCTDEIAIEHFLNEAAQRLLPITLFVEHVKLVAPSDKTIIDWFVAGGYYQPATIPPPNLTIPPPNPVQQLQAKLDEALAKNAALQKESKEWDEKIAALATSLEIVEVENAMLREKIAAMTPKPVVDDGRKTYLHQLTILDINWINDTIYMHRQSVDIGVHMQAYHDHVCISERVIKAKYGGHITGREVVKYILYELREYKEITLVDLAKVLCDLHLNACATELQKHFNM